MGRPKKVVEQVVVEPEQLVDGEESVAEVSEKPLAKGVSYSITASFKTRTMEGDRIVHKYQGVGKSLAEALDTVVGSDEDLVDEYNKPFPKGLNILTNITLKTSTGYKFDRAVAPHVARDIFENKNAVLAARLLGA